MTFDSYAKKLKWYYIYMNYINLLPTSGKNGKNSIFFLYISIFIGIFFMYDYYFGIFKNIYLIQVLLKPSIRAKFTKQISWSWLDHKLLLPYLN